MGDMRAEEERYEARSGNLRGPGSGDWGWRGECMRIWGVIQSRGASIWVSQNRTP